MWGFFIFFSRARKNAFKPSDALSVEDELALHA
jgi:hypothetical protein